MRLTDAVRPNPIIFRTGPSYHADAEICRLTSAGEMVFTNRRTGEKRTLALTPEDRAFVRQALEEPPPDGPVEGPGER